jgi:hypothetical protein
MSLIITIAAPFRHTRKERLKKNEIVYYLAFDRKWMSIEQVHLLLERALEEGLIDYDGDMILPKFDVTTVDIPLGYKPSSGIFEKAEPGQQIINRIVKATGNPETRVIAEINSIITDLFDGHIKPEAAVVILAKRYQVPFEDALPALMDQVLKKD